MTWVKIDDQFYDNPTNRSLGPLGRDLFLAGLTYCAKGLTDGVIPKTDLPLILAQAQAKRATVGKLLDAGRWLDMGDYLEVAEYLTYQPSKAKVLSDRERERKKKQRQRAEMDEPVPPYVPMGTPPRDTPQGVPRPPSRPVPSKEPSSSSSVPPEVWDRLARKKLAMANGVNNAPSWLRKVTANDQAELGPRADELWAMFDISPSQLADVLASGGSSPLLNSLQRRETA